MISNDTWKGKRVIIQWTLRAQSKGCDWPSFVVLDECEDGLWLQGCDSPNGCPHDGSKAYGPNREIASIMEWRWSQ